MVDWLPCRTASEGSGLASMAVPPLAKPAETAAVPSTSTASRTPLRAYLKSALKFFYLHAAHDRELLHAAATLGCSPLVDTFSISECNDVGGMRAGTFLLASAH